MDTQKRKRSATASSTSQSSKSKSAEVKPTTKKPKNLKASELNDLLDLFGSINLGAIAAAPAPAVTKKKTRTKRPVKPELSELDKLALAFGKIGVEKKTPLNQRKARPVAVPRTSTRAKTKILPEIKLEKPSNNTVLLMQTVKLLDRRSGEMNALDDMLSQIITKLEKKEKYATLEKLLKHIHRDVIDFIDGDDVLQREKVRANLDNKPDTYRLQKEKALEIVRTTQREVRIHKYEEIAEEFDKLENSWVPRFRELDTLITRIHEKRDRIKQLVQQTQQDEVFDLFNQFGL